MNQLTVSVIIPIKNEEKYIHTCLEQLAHQTYDLNRLELIVIDGDSQDNTCRIVEDFKKQYSTLSLKMINDENCQRSSALNKGIMNAKGEIIVRIDARSEISHDYITNCVKALLETNADNVGGIQKPFASERLNLTQIAIGNALSHPFGVGNAQFRVGKQSGYVDSVYLGCFRRSVFEKIGLFDTESPIITEDSDINYRIRKSGGKVYLNKDIVVYYKPRENMRDFAKLYFRYGGARAGFLRKWKVITGYRQLVPPLFLLGIIFLLIASFIQPVFLLFLLAILGVYWAVDFSVSFTLAKRNRRWELLPRLLLIFPLMHFSWALGFWRRILQRNKCSYWGF